MTNDEPRYTTVETVIFVLAVINFVSFLLISQIIGGDALNGHEKDGHYYLQDHGSFTEVSSAIFSYSRWHFISVWITHAVAAVTALRRHFRLNSRDRK